MQVIIKKSPRKDKKLEAIVDGKKTVPFGATGYSDYTLHTNPERKQRYIDRHKNNEDWGRSGIASAGFYSRWVLWNKPSISSSIQDLNKKYKDIIFKYIS